MVLPYQWPQLIKAMNMPELADDACFRDPRSRRDNNQALAAIIEDWLSRFASRDEAMAVLEAERVPCAPVLTLHEAMAHPHLRERGTVRRVADAAIGEFDIPGLAAKFSRWRTTTALTADRLGEHNVDVLRNVLGLTEAEIAELYREKTIVCDPLLDEKR
jgi:crotonobetainyl-CoA:carnitine CoA-transferase CaiB-like acyl-CoA transferase